jgi:hypothetical protein
VRKLQCVALLSVSVLAVACGKDAARTTVNDDLKRDLDLAASSATVLASAQAANAFSPTEVAPAAAPEIKKTLKKGAGPKAVRSKAPTVKATPEPVEVAEAESPSLMVTSVASAPESAPDPSVDNSMPAVPRPTPAAIPVSYPSGQGADNGSGAGSGVGAVLGGILGAVIRGGAVDGDRCEIHQRPRQGTSTYPPGVYQGIPQQPQQRGGVQGRGSIYGRRR